MPGLSFDFDKVQLERLGQRDIPTDKPLYATIENLEDGTAKSTGKPQVIITLSVFIDENEQDKAVQFKSYIGENHGWLIAQYLQALGEDFRALSNQQIDASTLAPILLGNSVMCTFKGRTYTYKNQQGQDVEGQGVQLNKISAVA